MALRLLRYLEIMDLDAPFLFLEITKRLRSDRTYIKDTELGKGNVYLFIHQDLSYTCIMYVSKSSDHKNVLRKSETTNYFSFQEKRYIDK